MLSPIRILERKAEDQTITRLARTLLLNAAAHLKGKQ